MSLGPGPPTCPSCGGAARWESVLEEDEERWLAVCRCGRMRAFLPELPALEPEDPLRAFLIGPGRPVFSEAPPGVRLFLVSVEGPEPVRWRYCHGPCETCGASAMFGMQACPRPGTLALSALCLACGNATVQYSKPSRNLVEAPIAGRAWSPPCPAVQRLRDCVHRPFSQLRVSGWRFHGRDELEGERLRVWLDDVRAAPSGWVRVTTPEEAIELLRTGNVCAISLDHDLGLGTPEAERSGYSVLLWLERELAEARWAFPLPEIGVHSANPVGRARMERAIVSIRLLHGARIVDRSRDVPQSDGGRRSAEVT